MDTYRVELPQPQPVTNEEEFVTNSGRKIKQNLSAVTVEDLNRGSDLLKTPLRDGEDMLGSGLSVLSASPGEIISARERDLSNSVQAELHLSLDRLSENYDHDDIKRMEKKSDQSKKLQSTKTQLQENNQIKTQVSNRSQGSVKNEHTLAENFSRDSLDVDVTTPLNSSESSAEFIDSENEDQHTIVADSLNFSSAKEGEGKSETSGADSSRILGYIQAPPPRSVVEDKYSDLRYNPNWRTVDSSNVEVASPVVIDFNAAPKLEDSLDLPLSSQRGGGEIVVHKKDIFSPILSEKESEIVPQLSIFSSRSISPTRLSTDPVRLQQTNAKYEEEFNKMLEAEVLNNGGENTVKDDRILSPINESTVMPRAEAHNPRKESHSLLIRKIDSQEKRLPSNDTTPVRLAGYQLLPDRHRIPSPSRGPNSQERIPDKPPIMPKQSIVGQGRYRSPEAFAADRKDPLTALSPREKHRVNLAPTPPKVPKPRNIDYVELNRQRLGRKTNSAGYLDLHNKRARQADLVKARSHSELKGSVSKHDYSNQVVSPGQTNESEYMIGTVEDIWSKQAMRLKIAKGESVNKGKVRRSPIKPGDNFFRVSPRHRSHQMNGAQMMEMHQTGGDAWYSHNQHEFVETAGFGLHSHQHNNRDHHRHPLPVPSQQVLMHVNGQEVNREELMDSLNESRFRKQYFSPGYEPTMQLDQDSPMMKAYTSKFGNEYSDHPAFVSRIENPQQNFIDKNLNLPPQRMIVNHAEIWTNQDDETSPTSNYHNTKAVNRKVTFLGDNEPISIEGIMDGESFFEPPSGNVYDLQRYKIPLPPTPPSKSLRHTMERGRQRSTGKENVGFQDYHDVRQDNYPVLPPILKSHQKSSPLKVSPSNRNIETLNAMPEIPGGYLEQHGNQKKKFKYKKYTLTDYKNLKKDVKLGGLGPDLESAREKYEKAERAKRYAEIVRKEHMSAAKIKELPAEENEISFYDENYHFSATMDDKQRTEMSEKRKRAIDYSKRIPRPKPKPKVSSQEDGKKSGLSMGTSSSEQSPSILTSNNQEGIDFNWGLLQMLKERHEKEKAQVATFSGNS